MAGCRNLLAALDQQRDMAGQRLLGIERGFLELIAAAGATRDVRKEGAIAGLGVTLDDRGLTAN